MIDDLYKYTGSWFCYSSKALAIIGNGNVSGHTFIIAVMKYVMIVHHEKVRHIGKEKAKKIFLVINVLYPIYMFCIFNIFNPDFLFIYGHISAANRCLGESELSSALDPNKTALKLHDMCKISDPVRSWSIMKFLQLSRSIVCWFHIVFKRSRMKNLIDSTPPKAAFCGRTGRGPFAKNFVIPKEAVKRLMNKEYTDKGIVFADLPNVFLG